jgi:hypothetical protein
MPVLLFDSTSTFHSTWAGQWQRADPDNRRTVPIGGVGSHEQLRDVIVNAVRLAGQTAFNELILAVGHGGGTGDAGTLDLAPNLRMRLARGTIGSRNAKGTETLYDPFYDFVFSSAGLKPKSDKTQDEDWVRQNDRVNLAGAKFRLGRSAIYQSIGNAIRANNIQQVVFMTCNVGNAVDFIKKIAFDWQVKVRAYQRFIVFQLNVGGTGKARAFFEGDAPGTGSNTTAAETDPPQSAFITVGPPFSTPQPSRTNPSPQVKQAVSSPWTNIDGQLVHPDAPAGGGGPGYFRTAGIPSGDESPVNLPDPWSPAAMSLDPLEILKFS